MMDKNEYDDFANKCSDAGKDLNEEMGNEIERIIFKYDGMVDWQVMKIMDLIHAVKYEW